MADEATASGGLRDDRNVCQLCGALENLSLCAGCHSTWYCSKDHQREHWKLHKRKCKAKKSHKASGSKREEGDNTQASGNTSTSCDTYSKATSPCGKCEESKASEGKDKSISSQASNDSRQTTGEEEPKSETASASKPENSEIASVKEEEKNLTQNPTTSRKKKAKSAKKGNARNETGQLPAISEEGSERYFLDGKLFPRAAQSRNQMRDNSNATAAMAPEGGAMATNSKDAYLDVMLSRFDETAKYVVDCLNTYGICVMDCFLGEQNGQEILSEVQYLKEQGLMRQGQVVHAGATSSGKIRGDIITWVDGREERCENIRYLVSCMDAVVLKCSSLLESYTINERTKAMVACYPGRATGYVRHVDNPNHDGRCITCIYYLNKDWDVRRDGGMLRIYPEGIDRVADIEPKFDRVLFFWSDRRNPHEVLPSNKERFAITVWYYEAEERARALKRFKGETMDHPKKQAVPLFNKIPDSNNSCPEKRDDTARKDRFDRFR